MMLSALIRLVLRLYPRAFRERFGPEMLERAAAIVTDSKARGKARRGVWLLWDSVLHIPAAYGMERRRRAGMTDAILRELRDSIRGGTI